MDVRPPPKATAILFTLMVKVAPWLLVMATRDATNSASGSQQMELHQGWGPALSFSGLYLHSCKDQTVAKVEW